VVHVNLEVVTFTFREEVVGAESLVILLVALWLPCDLIPPTVEVLLEVSQLGVNLVNAVVQLFND